MMRILVVDDDDDVRSTVVAALRNAGYEVSEAANGRTGLEVFRANVPDLVIMDLVMPEKEGIETIVELRRDFPGVKIIAISGGRARNEQAYLPMARTLGAIRTLSKPFTIEELREAVQAALGATDSG